MIAHGVLFHGRPGRLNELDAWIEDFLGRIHEIDGIPLATAGRNVNPRGEPYTHLIVLRLVDQVVLDAYNTSAAHTRFVERLVVRQP